MGEGRNCEIQKAVNQDLWGRHDMFGDTFRTCYLQFDHIACAWRHPAVFILQISICRKNILSSLLMERQSFVYHPSAVSPLVRPGMVCVNFFGADGVLLLDFPGLGRLTRLSFCWG